MSILWHTYGRNDGEEEAKGFVKAILELEENGYLDGEAKERV